MQRLYIIEKSTKRLWTRFISAFVVFAFSINVIIPPSYAQSTPTLLNLPAPGTMVMTTPIYHPALVKGLMIYPDNPLKFDFIIDKGDTKLSDEDFKKESTKLIKYFLASLTTPEKEMWVNLSPYEKDRIIPQGFGQTEMGRDMLAQDYLLKQLSASLMYPEGDLGKSFWDRVYKKAKEKFNTTDIPMNTFNKIWIVPEKALVYEHEKGAFVVKSHLKVMLEEDYLALEANKNSTKHGLGDVKREDLKVISGVQSQVVREVLIPEIEKEVNEGKTFANLRQIFNSVILASWYKQALKESLLGKFYVDKSKNKGIEVEDKQINQKIYDQYVAAFKKGVYDYIKEDYDPNTQQIIPRKYFSGGVVAAVGVDTTDANDKATSEAVADAVADLADPTQGATVTTTLGSVGSQITEGQDAITTFFAKPRSRRDFGRGSLLAAAVAAFGSGVLSRRASATETQQVTVKSDIVQWVNFEKEGIAVDPVVSQLMDRAKIQGQTVAIVRSLPAWKRLMNDWKADAGFPAPPFGVRTQIPGGRLALVLAYAPMMGNGEYDLLAHELFHEIIASRQEPQRGIVFSQAPLIINDFVGIIEQLPQKDAVAFEQLLKWIYEEYFTESERSKGGSYSIKYSIKGNGGRQAVSSVGAFAVDELMTFIWHWGQYGNLPGLQERFDKLTPDEKAYFKNVSGTDQRIRSFLNQSDQKTREVFRRYFEDTLHVPVPRLFQIEQDPAMLTGRSLLLGIALSGLLTVFGGGCSSMKNSPLTAAQQVQGIVDSGKEIKIISREDAKKEFGEFYNRALDVGKKITDEKYGQVINDANDLIATIDAKLAQGGYTTAKGSVDDFEGIKTALKYYKLTAATAILKANLGELNELASKALAGEFFAKAGDDLAKEGNGPASKEKYGEARESWKEVQGRIGGLINRLSVIEGENVIVAPGKGSAAPTTGPADTFVNQARDAQERARKGLEKIGDDEAMFSEKVGLELLPEIAAHMSDPNWRLIVGPEGLLKVTEVDLEKQTITVVREGNLGYFYVSRGGDNSTVKAQRGRPTTVTVNQYSNFALWGSRAGYEMTRNNAFRAFKNHRWVPHLFGLDAIYKRLVDSPKADSILEKVFIEVFPGPEPIGQKLKTLYDSISSKTVFRTEYNDKIKEIILQYYRQTGEDLIRAGVLESFLREDADQKVWPIFHRDGGTNAAAWPSIGNVPSDVDFYFREQMFNQGVNLLNKDEQADPIIGLNTYYPTYRNEHRSDEFSQRIIRAQTDFEEGRRLAQENASRLKDALVGQGIDIKDIDLIVPVPSFKPETSQVVPMTDELSKALNIPTNPAAFKKIRSTENQSTIRNLFERIINVVGAFEADSQALANKTVLIFDDNVTTKATLLELARVTMEAGAKRVILVALGKTIEKDRIAQDDAAMLTVDEKFITQFNVVRRQYLRAIRQGEPTHEIHDLAGMVIEYIKGIEILLEDKAAKGNLEAKVALDDFREIFNPIDDLRSPGGKDRIKTNEPEREAADREFIIEFQSNIRLKQVLRNIESKLLGEDIARAAGLDQKGQVMLERYVEILAALNNKSLTESIDRFERETDQDVLGLFNRTQPILFAILQDPLEKQAKTITSLDEFLRLSDEIRYQLNMNASRDFLSAAEIADVEADKKDLGWLRQRRFGLSQTQGKLRSKAGDSGRVTDNIEIIDASIVRLGGNLDDFAMLTNAVAIAQEALDRLKKETSKGLKPPLVILSIGDEETIADYELSFSNFRDRVKDVENLLSRLLLEIEKAPVTLVGNIQLLSDVDLDFSIMEESLEKIRDLTETLRGGEGRFNPVMVEHVANSISGEILFGRDQVNSSPAQLLRALRELIKCLEIKIVQKYEALPASEKMVFPKEAIREQLAQTRITFFIDDFMEKLNIPIRQKAELVRFFRELGLNEVEEETLPGTGLWENLYSNALFKPKLMPIVLHKKYPYYHDFVADPGYTVSVRDARGLEIISMKRNGTGQVTINNGEQLTARARPFRSPASDSMSEGAGYNFDAMVVNDQLIIINMGDTPITIKLDEALVTKKAEYGGIDMNPMILEREVQKNGHGVIIPMPTGPMPDMRNIEGFVPSIINIAPVTNLPLLLGIVTPNQAPVSSGSDTNSPAGDLGFYDKSKFSREIELTNI